MSRRQFSMPPLDDPKCNYLLAALPEPERQRWLPQLEPVHLTLGQVLYESAGRLSYAYFPTGAIVSLLYETERGASSEIAVVGKEGMVGTALFMGGLTTPGRAVVQRAGGAYRMNGQDLTHEFERSTPVMHLLLRYAQALMAQMAQRAVCNRHHSLDQQLCHWLLLRLDRLCESELAMTQEAIANNLGTRRESVTTGALKLQALGLIRYSRGHISVLDRRGLERRACECYAAVKQEYARLLPDTVVAQPAGPQHAGAPQREPTPALTANAGAAANANHKTTTTGTAHAGGFRIPAPRHEQRDEPALIAP